MEMAKNAQQHFAVAEKASVAASEWQHKETLFENQNCS